MGTPERVIRPSRRRRLGACLAGLTLCAVPSLRGAECPLRPMRVTFYTCAEGYAHCLTKRGHQPIPFRTIAVGDPKLLGRWLYVEDLGGWVLASDTGGRLRRNSMDVFIGDTRMAPHARRLGVQHWDVRVCEPNVAPAPPEAAPAPDAAPATPLEAPASPAPDPAAAPDRAAAPAAAPLRH